MNNSDPRINIWWDTWIFHKYDYIFKINIAYLFDIDNIFYLKIYRIIKMKNTFIDYLYNI